MRRPLVAALLICLFTSQAGWSQRPAEGDYADSSVMPAGIQGQRIQSLIDTLNSGDAEKVRQFLTTHCTEKFRNIAPMEGHIEVFLGRYQPGPAAFGPAPVFPLSPAGRKTCR